jgi:hypothetical protein
MAGMRSRLVLVCALAVSCADEGDDPESTTVAVATQVDPTMSTTDATGETSSGDATTSTTTSMTTESMTDPATSSDPSSVTIDPDTTAGAPTECDPKMAPFLGTPLPSAAIEIDFASSTCAAASAAGTAPQIVLDVQQSGNINALIFGMEIVDVSSGQPFDDSPMADAEVIDLSPDLVIALDLVSIDGGLPVTISFEVFSQGPTLLDVSATFG